MNTEFRKLAKSEFERNFYKLMNNSVFGKTVKNMQDRVNIKIVRTDEREKIRKLIASPLMYDFCYNELKSQYSHKGELLYTDTDSLLLEIEIDDF